MSRPGGADGRDIRNTGTVIRAGGKVYSKPGADVREPQWPGILVKAGIGHGEVAPSLAAWRLLLLLLCELRLNIGG